MKWIPVLTLSATLAALFQAPAEAFTLKGTVWERQSQRYCKVDPKLLYAVALVESKRYSGRIVNPNPLALNIADKPHHPASLSQAKQLLRDGLQKTRSIAVGAMQISIRWNGERVANPEDLLDLETNVRIGTQVLCEMIDGQHGDLELAIGRYHTPNPKLESVAREYGRNVLTIWRRLILLERKEA
ncbi:lytic transglycosylase domain-containing protein [Pseudomonas aeruginosa]|uniref:transglycosylase SLT domain-containing protein n=1 Tax=Pseudomonas aeruginosa TaxID=287 RepID=UPI00093D7F0D|nr:transglycosylase SLT domain-containing protein [Pseudomonas aeruginosa]EKF7416929.1 transglycosylase SLT domain-containing protein [Pseudomonas aeruginosa]RNF58531.1 lytic transglycosylase domain-containing protein [Pseudomonas aeruginosa]